MNQEVKDKWIFALRSGKYEQGRNALFCEGKYCCMGVLCDLFAKEKNIEWENGEFFSQDNHKAILKETAIIPDEVQLWAGIKSKNPSITIEGQKTTSLGYLNDYLEYSFEDIAHLIEKQL